MPPEPVVALTEQQNCFSSRYIKAEAGAKQRGFSSSEFKSLSVGSFIPQFLQDSECILVGGQAVPTKIRKTLTGFVHPVSL